MIYGNAEDRNISKLIRLVGKCAIVPLPGGGRSIFQPVHVDDLAACILAALKTPASAGKTLRRPRRERAFAAGDRRASSAEILGKKVLTVPFPLGLAEAAVGAAGEGSSRAPFIRREQIERLREDKRYDYSEAAQDLGYAPRELHGQESPRRFAHVRRRREAPNRSPAALPRPSPVEALDRPHVGLRFDRDDGAPD